jgi:hypothetical protein
MATIRLKKLIALKQDVLNLKDVKLKGFKDIEEELALEEEQKKIDAREQEIIDDNKEDQQISSEKGVISGIKQAMVLNRYK